MTIIIPCSLGNGFYTFGFLILIIDQRNFLYYSLYIYTHRRIIKAHLLHQSLGSCVCLSFFLSLSLSLPGWFLGAQRPNLLTLLPRLLRLSREGTLCLHPSSRGSPVPSWETQVLSQILYWLVFCINQGVSASFFLSLSYRHLRTARSQSIKGPQQFSLPIYIVL